MDAQPNYADAMLAEASALLSHVNAMRSGDKEAEKRALDAFECAHRTRVAALDLHNRAVG